MYVTVDFKLDSANTNEINHDVHLAYSTLFYQENSMFLMVRFSFNGQTESFLFDFFFVELCENFWVNSKWSHGQQVLRQLVKSHVQWFTSDEVKCPLLQAIEFITYLGEFKKGSLLDAL